MDDFVLSNLHESRNEWSARLVSILSPVLMEGIQSIFDEAWKLCVESGEANKYLMTFQNLLCGIPKWTATILDNEKTRIIERSGCNYLEDLISCVHIIQLKVLTCVRVANKSKKIEIAIPKLDVFLHKIYIHLARQVYSNVYLFEKTATPLQKQKYKRELEIMIQECILKAIRESIPTESIIRAYIDEVEVVDEQELVIETPSKIPVPEVVVDKPPVEMVKTVIPEVIATPSLQDTIIAMPKEEPIVLATKTTEPVSTIQFNDIDSIMTVDGKSSQQIIPKSIENLEAISVENAMRRRAEEQAASDSDKIKILDEPMDLGGIVEKIDTEPIKLDFEELS